MYSFYINFYTKRRRLAGFPRPWSLTPHWKDASSPHCLHQLQPLLKTITALFSIAYQRFFFFYLISLIRYFKSINMAGFPNVKPAFTVRVRLRQQAFLMATKERGTDIHY